MTRLSSDATVEYQAEMSIMTDWSRLDQGLIAVVRTNARCGNAYERSYTVEASIDKKIRHRHT